jgi:hypothetical protein
MKSNKKSLSKTLLVMDLDDANINLRFAEKEYNQIKKERETLQRWHSDREIPAELLEEIEYRRETVLVLENEVKQLQERINNYDESVKSVTGCIIPELKMPDELKELKLRLEIELDDERNPDVERVIDEWYEEYQDKYEQPIDTPLERELSGRLVILEQKYFAALKIIKDAPHYERCRIYESRHADEYPRNHNRVYLGVGDCSCWKSEVTE